MLVAGERSEIAHPGLPGWPVLGVGGGCGPGRSGRWSGSAGTPTGDGGWSWRAAAVAGSRRQSADAVAAGSRTGQTVIFASAGPGSAAAVRAVIGPASVRTTPCGAQGLIGEVDVHHQRSGRSAVRAAAGRRSKGPTPPAARQETRRPPSLPPEHFRRRSALGCGVTTSSWSPAWIARLLAPCSARVAGRDQARSASSTGDSPSARRDRSSSAGLVVPAVTRRHRSRVGGSCRAGRSPIPPAAGRPPTDRSDRLVGGDLLPRLLVRVGVVGVPGQQVSQPGRVGDDPDRFRHPHRQRVLITVLGQGIRRPVGTRRHQRHIAGFTAGDQGPQPVIGLGGPDFPFRRRQRLPLPVGLSSTCKHGGVQRLQKRRPRQLLHPAAGLLIDLRRPPPRSAVRSAAIWRAFQ